MDPAPAAVYRPHPDAPAPVLPLDRLGAPRMKKASFLAGRRADTEDSECPPALVCGSNAPVIGFEALAYVFCSTLFDSQTACAFHVFTGLLRIEMFDRGPVRDYSNSFNLTWGAEALLESP